MSLGQTLEDLLNAHGRSRGHIAEGVALCAGAALLAALVASRRSPGAVAPYGRVRLFGVVAAPLTLVTALSGLRVWNAPASRERTHALELWGVLQLMSAVAALISPGRRAAQLAAAVGALGAGVGYAVTARKVDAAAASLVSPHVGWPAVTSLIAGRFRHEAPTIH
jgi:hypothetical protein